MTQREMATQKAIQKFNCPQSDAVSGSDSQHIDRHPEKKQAGLFWSPVKNNIMDI